MGVFDSSSDLERSVLSALMKDVKLCRLFLFRFKEDHFSSEARRFIFDVIKKEFTITQDLTPETLISCEILSKHESDKTVYLGELKYIISTPPLKGLETSLKKLSEFRLGRETAACIEEVGRLVSEGCFVEAAGVMRHKSFSLCLSEDTKTTKEFFSTTKQRIAKARDKRDNPGKYSGLLTGFKTFDVKTGGLHKGEMTLIAGITGLGKSTILKQIEFGILTHNHGKNILHIANEEYEEQVDSKFDAVMTGMDYLDIKFADKEVLTEETLRNWELLIDNISKNTGGKLYTREVPAFSDVSVIRRVVFELKAEGVDIHAIFIDHLPNMKPVQKAYSENNEREKCAAEVKELAKELKVPIVIPTQAATQVEEKQMKGKRAGKLDVYGSKGQIHHANTFAMITYLGRDHKTLGSDGSIEKLEHLKDVFILLDVKKNRDGPCFPCKLRHRVKSGRMEEVEIDPEIAKKFDRQHAESLRSGDYSSLFGDDMQEKAKAVSQADIEVEEIEGIGKEPAEKPEEPAKKEDPPVREKPARKSLFSSHGVSAEKTASLIQ